MLRPPLLFLRNGCERGVVATRASSLVPLRLLLRLGRGRLCCSHGGGCVQQQVIDRYIAHGVTPKVKVGVLVVLGHVLLVLTNRREQVIGNVDEAAVAARGRREEMEVWISVMMRGLMFNC